MEGQLKEKVKHLILPDSGGGGITYPRPLLPTALLSVEVKSGGGVCVYMGRQVQATTYILLHWPVIGTVNICQLGNSSLKCLCVLEEMRNDAQLS